MQQIITYIFSKQRTLQIGNQPRSNASHKYTFGPKKRKDTCLKSNNPFIRSWKFKLKYIKYKCNFRTWSFHPVFFSSQHTCPNAGLLIPTFTKVIITVDQTDSHCGSFLNQFNGNNVGGAVYGEGLLLAGVFG